MSTPPPPFFSINPTPRHAIDLSEFLSLHWFSRRPVSLSDATTRLKSNLSYFHINYYTIFLIVLFFSLVLRPLSLFLVFVPSLAWCFIYSAPRYSSLQVYVFIFIGVVLAVLTVVGLVLAHVWMNLLVAVVISTALVVMHGVYWVPRDPHPYSFLPIGAEVET